MFDFTRPLFGIARDPAPAGVLDEVARTPLGRQLLDFLKRNDVEIHFDYPGGMAAGAYYYEDKKIYVCPDLSFAEKVHVFAHEARHALQHLAAAQPADTAASLNPLSFLYKERLCEMDAEAFAVFFVHDLSRRTGRDFFDTMRGAGDSSKLSGLAAMPLYKKFAKALGDGDAAPAMRAAFLEFPLLQYRIDYYADTGIERWRRHVWNPLSSNFFSRDKNFAVQFRASMARRQSCRDFLIERAKAFSGMCRDWGVPDYLADAKPDDFIPCIAGSTYPAPLLEKNESEVKKARRDFRRMAKRLMRKASKSENSPRGLELNYRLWGI